MTARYFVCLIALFVAACSSTLHYRAIGSYSMDPDSGDVLNCSNQASEACIPINLTWETERYCGIYKKAPDSLSDEHLRVGSSPTTVDEWEVHDGQTVFQGDDERFEVVVGEPVLIDSDFLCGQFAPPVNLLDVRAGEVLTLKIFCNPIVNGIRLMPASAIGYRLDVEVVEREKSWLGCSK
jgi:hypothetical protein